MTFNPDLLGDNIERLIPGHHHKDSSALVNFATRCGLIDTRNVNGDFDVHRDHTYNHYNGSYARLDYILSSNQETVIAHTTKDFNRIATNHRLITTEFDLFGLLGGWKTPLNAHVYPAPIRVSREDTSKDATFARIEIEWTKTLDPTLVRVLVEGDNAFDDFISERQEDLLKKLNFLCVDKAGTISSNLRRKFTSFRKKKTHVINTPT